MIDDSTLELIDTKVVEHCNTYLFKKNTLNVQELLRKEIIYIIGTYIPDILERMKDYDVRLTVNSDAILPSHIDIYFERFILTPPSRLGLWRQLTVEESKLFWNDIPFNTFIGKWWND